MYLRFTVRERIPATAGVNEAAQADRISSFETSASVSLNQHSKKSRGTTGRWPWSSDTMSLSEAFDTSLSVTLLNVFESNQREAR
jgi:hypothetical protein